MALKRREELPGDWWTRDALGVRKKLEPEPTVKLPERTPQRQKRAALEVPKLLTFQEVRDALKIGETTLKKLIREGRLTVQPVAGCRRIPLASLTEYLEEERRRYAS